ncbi:MAG: 3'-5' exonuclease [Candidatus Kapabacteria bacterium]|nr:3'-5' exonuclease [Candidatus Kapabacteria bacterium]
MYLFFDVETTGLPKYKNAPVSDIDAWPRIVQIAWQLYDINQKLIVEKSYIVKPEGFIIPKRAIEIHGITNEIAQNEGKDLDFVLQSFKKVLLDCEYVIAHNFEFDSGVVRTEFSRKFKKSGITNKKSICTMKSTTKFCKLTYNPKYGDYKWPKLSELHMKLFNFEFENSHNSLYDVRATAKCFWELKSKYGFYYETHKQVLYSTPIINSPKVLPKDNIIFDNSRITNQSDWLNNSNQTNRYLIDMDTKKPKPYYLILFIMIILLILIPNIFSGLATMVYISFMIIYGLYYVYTFFFGEKNNE